MIYAPEKRIYDTSENGRRNLLEISVGGASIIYVSRRSAEVSSRPANTNKYKDLTATHCRNILTFQEDILTFQEELQ